MSWLTIGFWGCALMWLISLAGDVGLARNPEVAEGLQWLPLISAIVAFIGMSTSVMPHRCLAGETQARHRRCTHLIS